MPNTKEKRKKKGELNNKKLRTESSGSFLVVSSKGLVSKMMQSESSVPASLTAPVISSSFNIGHSGSAFQELLALGDVIGTESRGLSAGTIASLPSVTYKANQDGNTDQCVICRLEYEEDESLVMLSCKHLYHPECINNWLHVN
ncbi:hypothetical protein H6P81_018736 [Aristolochia fimbriata]|uniref:RING-type domain-containing protein n=1 Tax=Aristolochia fimbriata TaxID=158543 RepID=A0AAV7E253_ARIFI|nr:hypothetical protein H6P81_018736 [Aristolochia fimbriata]